jgi:hypothetical protein
MSFVTKSQAAEYFWISPTGGSWTNSQNWDFAVPDDPTDIASFALPGAYSVSSSASLHLGRISVRSGDVTLNMSGDMYLSGIAGTGLWIGGNESQPGIASLTVSGIGLGSSYNSYVGGFNQPTSHGTLTVRPSSEFSAGTLFVGHAGRGTVNLSGYHYGGRVYLGEQESGAGTYNMTGGALEVQSLSVGMRGSGTFNQSGGRTLIEGYPTGTPGVVSLAAFPNSSGVYNLSNGTFDTVGTLYVGIYGDATFSSTNGYASASELHIGGRGNFLLNSGALNAATQLIGIGNGAAGNARLSQSGGINTATDIALGWEGHVDGQYLLSAGTCITGTSRVLQGEWTHSGGTHLSNHLKVGGDNPGSTGAAYVQNGGTVSVGSIVLGNPAVHEGVYRLNAGTCMTQQVSVIRQGQWIQSGGLHWTPGIQIFATTGASGPSAYAISGGTLLAGTVENYSAITQTGGRVDAGDVYATVDMGTLTVSGGTFAAQRIRQQRVIIDGSGGAAPTVVVKSNGTEGGPSRFRLTLTGDGVLDLTDNDLQIPGGDLYTVSELVRQGRNFGSWDGHGLISSEARTDPTGGTTLGVMSGVQYRSVYGPDATFGGLPVSTDEVLVKYTYYGDTDFNGVIDGDDYARLDNGYLTAGWGWFKGDFDYSGVIDADDYALIDNAYNVQSGTLLRAVEYLIGDDRSPQGMNQPALRVVRERFEEFGAGYATQFLSAVPEPGALAFPAALLVFAGRRRFGSAG